MTEIIVGSYQYDLKSYGNGLNSSLYTLEFGYYDGLKVARLNGYSQDMGGFDQSELIDQKVYVVTCGYVIFFFSEEPVILASPGQMSDEEDFESCGQI